MAVYGFNLAIHFVWGSTLGFKFLWSGSQGHADPSSGVQEKSTETIVGLKELALAVFWLAV